MNASGLLEKNQFKVKKSGPIMVLKRTGFFVVGSLNWFFAHDFSIINFLIFPSCSSLNLQLQLLYRAFFFSVSS